MGHYDKEYEKYYSKLLNIKTIRCENKDTNNNKIFFDEHKFMKKNKETVFSEFKKSILFGVLGSVILSGLLLCCKASTTKYAQDIYKQMKEIVSTDFYYKKLEVAKKNEDDIIPVNASVSNEMVKSDGLIPFDDFHVVKKSKDELLKESKVTICKGEGYEIKEVVGEKGLIVKANDREVMNVLDGIVSKIDKHKDLGTEIIIDHGENVSTRYLNIKNVTIKVGDSIKENGVIGYSLDNKEKDLKGVLFQVWIDGKIQDMNNYGNFINN